MTRALEALFDGEAEELTRKAIKLAKAGDMTALRLCLDRIVPPRKDRPIGFSLPTMKEPADAADALASIVAAVADGELMTVPSNISPSKELAQMGTRESGSTIARLHPL
jgi:hypothetical protein